MARFFDAVGFSTGSTETEPGVWEEGIVERKYYGDVVQNSRQLVDGEKVNDDLSVGNSIRILADGYANENIFAMRYIRWAGTNWEVANVTEQRPRLLIRLGGVYHGKTA